MSASAAVTPSSWRGDQHGHGHLSHSAYDPALSFAYTSVSGTRGGSAMLTSAASLGGPTVRYFPCNSMFLINAHLSNNLFIIFQGWSVDT